MTSKEIRATAVNTSKTFWVKEIAYQLAVIAEFLEYLKEASVSADEMEAPK